MEELYRTYPDPWAYSTTALERYAYVLNKVKNVLEKANIGAEAILEVGCSEGVFTELLTENFPVAKIYGFDISKTALIRATERTAGKNVRYYALDIGKRVFPLPDRTIQLLFLCDVLYMLPSREDVEFAVREVNRVLGPDGIVVITEFTKTRKFSDMVCGAIGNRLHDSRGSIHFDIHPTTGKRDDTQSYRFLIFGRRQCDGR
jgi:ubiquinone/menaquinone biosynthesis C-methylase UbiE